MLGWSYSRSKFQVVLQKAKFLLQFLCWKTWLLEGDLKNEDRDKEIEMKWDGKLRFSMASTFAIIGMNYWNCYKWIEFWKLTYIVTNYLSLFWYFLSHRSIEKRLVCSKFTIPKIISQKKLLLVLLDRLMIIPNDCSWRRKSHFILSLYYYLIDKCQLCSSSNKFLFIFIRSEYIQGDNPHKGFIIILAYQNILKIIAQKDWTWFEKNLPVY